MRKRKNLVIAFLLIAFLFMGIGYAVVTDTLKVTGGGQAAVDPSNLEVEFTNVEEATLCTVVISHDPVTATMTVSGLDTAGQVATAIIEVTNNTLNAVDNEWDADLSAPSFTNNNTEYFDIAVSWEDAEGNTIVVDASNPLTLKAARNGDEAGKVYLKVVVTLKKGPSDAANLPTADFEVSFTATTPEA